MNAIDCWSYVLHLTTHVLVFTHSHDFIGFSAIQWWASVGIVACYWSAGEDSRAEDYYPFIEATSGDGAAVSTVLQLAFKAYRMHKRPNDSVPAPLDVMLQLCAMTSNSLQTAVNDLLQDRTTSTENELNQVSKWSTHSYPFRE